MFCDPGLVFGCTESVGSHFHVLRSRTHFWRYRGRWFSFSCFARPDSFSLVSSASGPDFIFCAPGHVFGGTECVWSRFHVLRAPTHFRQYRGHPIPFSCLLRSPGLVSAVPRATGPELGTGPVFMFCTSGLVFEDIEGVGSRFDVLRVRTRYRWYRGCQVPFSCFCTPRHVFSGAECVGSRFHVLCARNHFQRSRGRQVLFSCFACPDSFYAVMRESGLVFMFCAPGLIFGGTEGVRSRFHILCARTHF
jgi:hypothetical protein